MLWVTLLHIAGQPLSGSLHTMLPAVVRAVQAHVIHMGIHVVT